MTFARRGYCQSLATAGTPGVKHLLTTLSGHPFSETVSRTTTSFAGLICAFHDLYYLPSKLTSSKNTAESNQFVSTFLRMSLVFYPPLALKVNFTAIFHGPCAKSHKSNIYQLLQPLTTIPRAPAHESAQECVPHANKSVPYLTRSAQQWLC